MCRCFIVPWSLIYFYFGVFDFYWPQWGLRRSFLCQKERQQTACRHSFSGGARKGIFSNRSARKKCSAACCAAGYRAGPLWWGTSGLFFSGEPGVLWNRCFECDSAYFANRKGWRRCGAAWVKIFRISVWDLLLLPNCESSPVEKLLTHFRISIQQTDFSLQNVLFYTIIHTSLIFKLISPI